MSHASGPPVQPRPKKAAPPTNRLEMRIIYLYDLL